MIYEWSRVRIEDIAEVKSGKRLPLGHTLSDKETPFPYIRLVDVSNGRVSKSELKYLMPETRACIKRYVVNTGDVCLAIVGHTIGMVFSIESCLNDVNLTENAARITNFSDSINSRYLYYYLTSPIGQTEILARKVGSAQGKLPLYNIKSLEVNIPSRKEQDKVVELLDNLSLRIELLRETNATLEAIAQALFKSWFVDFDPVRAKQEGRAPESMDEATAALFPDSFEESELGLVPRGWRIGILGDFLSLRNERTKPSDLTASLPYVPVESISSKSPFLQEYKSGEEANSSLILFRKGDVLFGAMRPYFHKVCSAPFDGVTRTTVFTLTPKNNLAAAFALFQAYQDTAIEYATQHSEGSTIPYAKWGGSLEKMPVVVPPKELQERYSDVVSQFIECANENLRQALTLSTLRETLLPRLISGQLRLPEAEGLVEALQ
jgi:type I restriction enzyme S subunit